MTMNKTGADLLREAREDIGDDDEILRGCQMYAREILGDAAAEEFCWTDAEKIKPLEWDENDPEQRVDRLSGVSQALRLMFFAGDVDQLARCIKIAQEIYNLRHPNAREEVFKVIDGKDK